MKKLNFCIAFLLIATFVQAQIGNNGFENFRDTLPTQPSRWTIKNVDGFTASLDSICKYSGRQSLSIKSPFEKNKDKFLPFSQYVEIDNHSLKRVAISTWIQTENIKGTAGLWCQVLDKDSKLIAFQNLEMQGAKINETCSWKKYSLVITVDTLAKKFLLGGYLQGTGTAWFDDFSIEELKSSTALPSRVVLKYIKKMNQIIKDNSIYSDSLDWKSINTDIGVLSLGMKTMNDANSLLPYMIQRLRRVGDNHSTYVDKKTSQKTQVENIDGRQPSAKLIGNSIGYIYLPGFESMSDTAMSNFASKIQTLIRNLDTNNSIEGWIVDLRENTGGNMYPMIAGLGPLVGEGKLGSFIIPQGKGYSWSYSNGRAIVKTTTITAVKNPYLLKNPNTKIAILIGPDTASSGEMTAISFVGKSNIKLVGTQSAGYTTGNGVYKLPDGSSLVIASAFIADKNNKKYPAAIVPDILVDKADESLIMDTAQKWLLDK